MKLFNLLLFAVSLITACNSSITEPDMDEIVSVDTTHMWYYTTPHFEFGKQVKNGWDYHFITKSEYDAIDASEYTDTECTPGLSYGSYKELYGRKYYYAGVITIVRRADLERCGIAECSDPNCQALISPDPDCGNKCPSHCKAKNATYDEDLFEPNESQNNK